MTRLRVSAPGRVCLFGEHQDYLHLPVVPCAISLRIAIEGERTPSPVASLDLPDISAAEEIPLRGGLAYRSGRDYLRSTVNVLRRRGFTWSSGLRCTVRGRIPINSGTSSSSALVVSWATLLARLSDQADLLTPDAAARIAHEAEVLEFGEPGGMMDHFSTAYGGVVAIDFHPSLAVRPLSADLGAVVLGDSGEPKDTKGILARVKRQVVDAAARLAAAHPGFSLHTATPADLDRCGGELSRDEAELLDGTLRNRDITGDARALLARVPLEHESLGALLTKHQGILREVLRISTPKIDRMLQAALDAGALGGKINGSGGGGCMFAYAPVEPERVARAVQREGGKAYIVRPDAGVAIEEEG